MAKLYEAGKVPLKCSRCDAVRPNGKFTVGYNVAEAIVEIDNVVRSVGIKGHLCPECCDLWRILVSQFWECDIEEELKERIAKRTAKEEADDKEKTE